MKVVVIGLGTMGMGAAMNLVRKGHQVTGCDVREAARAELSASGGAAIATASDLPAETEAVVVFVVNAAQTHDVLFGADEQERGEADIRGRRRRENEGYERQGRKGQRQARADAFQPEPQGKGEVGQGGGSERGRLHE